MRHSCLPILISLENTDIFKLLKIEKKVKIKRCVLVTIESMDQFQNKGQVEIPENERPLPYCMRCK